LIFCWWPLKKLKEYNYYLFDMDGTLIDTIELIYQSFLHTIKLYGGARIKRQEIISQIGLPLRQQLESCLGKKTDQEFGQIYTAHNEYQKKIASRYLAVFPHVHSTLSALKARGKKMAVVTSRSRNSLEYYLKIKELMEYFTVLVTPESTAKHKPDPEPVFKALSMFKASARECLFVGDSIWDLQCAGGAGMDTAFVAWSYTPLESLPLRPTYILHSMRDLIV
jgi:pyrophosphatase PpaX